MVTARNISAFKTTFHPHLHHKTAHQQLLIYFPPKSKIQLFSGYLIGINQGHKKVDRRSDKEEAAVFKGQINNRLECYSAAAAVQLPCVALQLVNPHVLLFLFRPQLLHSPQALHEWSHL